MHYYRTTFIRCDRLSHRITSISWRAWLAARASNSAACCRPLFQPAVALTWMKRLNGRVRAKGLVARLVRSPDFDEMSMGTGLLGNTIWEEGAATYTFALERRMAAPRKFPERKTCDVGWRSDHPPEIEPSFGGGIGVRSFSRRSSCSE